MEFHEKMTFFISSSLSLFSTFYYYAFKLFVLLDSCEQFNILNRQREKEIERNVKNEQSQSELQRWILLQTELFLDGLLFTIIWYTGYSTSTAIFRVRWQFLLKIGKHRVSTWLNSILFNLTNYLHIISHVTHFIHFSRIYKQLRTQTWNQTNCTLASDVHEGSRNITQSYLDSYFNRMTNIEVASN